MTSADVVYDHVAFDLDGTLIDSRADLTAAVNHVLRGLGLPELPPATLSRCVGGDSLPVRKPDPAGLDRLRALTATARERMLLVGDSGIDLRTARAGRVAFCGVAWGLAPEALEAARPERIIAHPRELVALVEGGLLRGANRFR